MKTPRAELEVTRACNLRCKTCLFSCNEALKNELTTKEIFSLIDQFKDMNIKWLKITGGEPLLRNDIFRIINYARKKGLKIRLNTNSTLISKQVAKKLNVDIVQVSVDGLEKTSDWLRGAGTFKKTIEAIQLLIDNDIKVHSNTVITQQNKGELFKLTDMLSETGISSLCYSRLINEGRCKSQYNNLSLSTAELLALKMKLMLHAKLKRIHITFDGGVAYFLNGCGISNTNPFITCSGNVTPCCTIREKAILGNIRKDSYAGITEKSQFTEPKTLFGNCNKCLEKL